ncbi:MAG: DNA-3-methyladenine glycosylase I [Ilumatobacteraceae bacterium]|nr:DNA-3-methyladenine glycosylase I [Ilumatobacteraceae bacterium]
MGKSIVRCSWCEGSDDYVAYHDLEWGRAVTDDTRLFEKICLEGFQSGLAWITVLRKRDAFREAFADFDPKKVARFTDARVEKLLGNAGIIRHRGKIESTINNARRLTEMHRAGESLAELVWSHADRGRPPAPSTRGSLPASTAASAALSKTLKQRGWSFVGPTTMHAFMQSMGVVNDHVDGCHVRAACERERRGILASGVGLVPRTDTLRPTTRGGAAR